MCGKPGGLVRRKMPHLAGQSQYINDGEETGPGGRGTYEGVWRGAHTMAMLSGIITW
jgi:hypothetical protein